MPSHWGKHYKFKDKKKVLYVWIPGKTKDVLKKEADSRDMSMTKLVAHILESAAQQLVAR